MLVTVANHYNERDIRSNNRHGALKRTNTGGISMGFICSFSIFFFKANADLKASVFCCWMNAELEPMLTDDFPERLNRTQLYLSLDRFGTSLWMELNYLFCECMPQFWIDIWLDNLCELEDREFVFCFFFVQRENKKKEWNSHLPFQWQYLTPTT